MRGTAFSGWTRQQKSVVIAAFLGWTLDAFDFFLLVFVLKDIAEEFSTGVAAVSTAIMLTLAMRPVGAVLFGRAADRWGRRPVLMIDILLYSLFGFASGLSPDLSVLIVLRAFFGIAMGGEWGVGASLAMETVPAQARGFVSGLLQSGYPAGYLIASAAYAILFPLLGWRGLLMMGVLPALLVFYIRQAVPESPGWDPTAARRQGILGVLKARWGLALYAVVLMTAFNFFSHGTQDLYPTFLRVQHGLSPHAVGTIAVIYNIGAIVGGIVGGALSERFGRRRMIVIAALLSLPIVPIWALSTNVVILALGAFLMQFVVQAAWGVIPAHLNELSPDEVRATFPGVVYQLGNLLASANATIQAAIAAHYGNDYGFALAIVASSVAIVIAILTAAGFEAKGVVFGARLAANPVSEGEVIHGVPGNQPGNRRGVGQL
jgi:MFS transporter, SHS family, lactate transporter